MTAPSFLEILWTRIKGELARELQSNAVTGFVSFVITRTTRMILTGLGPIGSLLGDISELFIKSSLSAIGPAYEEWQRGLYTVRSTQSGLTVLERPTLVTPQHKSIILPERLEIPTNDIIAPPRELLFNPLCKWRLQPPTSSVLSQIQARARTGKPPSLPSTLNLTSAIGKQRFISDVSYPQWILGKGSVRSTAPLLSAGAGTIKRPSRVPSLANRYLGNSTLARQFPQKNVNASNNDGGTKLKVKNQPAESNSESRGREQFYKLKAAANKGNPEAQFQLGKMYVTGRYFQDLFVEQNMERGYRLVAAAAKQGHVKAKYYLRTKT